MDGCPARYATPRTARRRTRGAEVERVARRLGVPLIGWQRQVCRVGLEWASGRPAYRNVIISIPRQSGKTTLALARIVWQMTAFPGSRTLYASQARLASRVKLLEEWWPVLAASPFADDLRLSRGFGIEGVTHANGSSLHLLSATESAGHGSVCDLAVVDEGWVHADARIEQAVRPTMITRRCAQFWIMSTAGTWRSAWWNAKCERARAAAQMGLDSGTAFFEWAADPADNPADPATWLRVMPALGRLSDLATVQGDFEAMGLAEFKRAMLNLTADPAAEGWALFSQDAWLRARARGMR